MRHRLALCWVIVGVIFAVGCGQMNPEPAEDPAKAAYSQFREAYLDSENRADQVALVEGFITEWPDHRNSGYFAADVIGYYADELGDPEKAYSIVAGVLDQAQDPEVRFWLGTNLAPVAADVGRDLDLEGLIADLEAEGELDFDQASQVLTAAAGLGDWELMDSWADAALARSTPEAFQADYPDHEFEADDLQRRANSRRVTALANKGWAAYNLGSVDDAMAAFKEADAIAEVNYVGVTGTPLARYWGEALWRQGEADRAIEVLTPEVIFGDVDGAEPALREAWAAANDGSQEYEEFLLSSRREIARTIDDFSLTDYQGAPVSLSGLRQGKVTLLAFWFPT